MSRYGLDGEPLIYDADEAFDLWRDRNPDEWDRMLGRTPGCPCARCSGRFAEANDPPHREEK